MTYEKMLPDPILYQVSKGKFFLVASDTDLSRPVYNIKIWLKSRFDIDQKLGWEWGGGIRTCSSQ